MSYLVPDEEGMVSQRLSDDTLLVYDPEAEPPKTGRWIYGRPVPNDP